jgi:hypothetical protein
MVFGPGEHTRSTTVQRVRLGQVGVEAGLAEVF